MEFDETVLKIVDAAATRHGDDIVAAVDEAEKKIRNMKSFPSLVDVLIRQAIQELVYRARSGYNQRLLNKRRPSHSKIRVASSRSVGKAMAKNYYLYNIGSKTLGSLLGKELPGLIESERAIGNGHYFRAALCEKLKPIVPSDTSVRRAVPHTKLVKIFQSLEHRYGVDDEAA